MVSHLCGLHFPQTVVAVVLPIETCGHVVEVQETREDQEVKVAREHMDQGLYSVVILEVGTVLVLDLEVLDHSWPILMTSEVLQIGGRHLLIGGVDHGDLQVDGMMTGMDHQVVIDGDHQKGGREVQGQVERDEERLNLHL